MPEATVVEAARTETITLKTTARDVLVVGAGHVSTRYISVLGAILEDIADGGDHGVNLVVLADNRCPITVEGEGDELKAVGVMADACMHAGAITINLEEILDRCIDTIGREGHEHICMYPVWWHNLLLSTIHEVIHCATFANDAKPVEWLEDFLTNKDGFAERVEKDTTAESISRLHELAKRLDIEPPNWGEEPFFGSAATIMYSGDPADGDDASAEKSKAIDWLNDRVMIDLSEGGKAVPVTTFRGYLHIMSGDDVDDESWNQTLQQIDEAPTVDNGFVQANAAVTEVDNTVTVDDPADGPEGVEVNNMAEAMEGMDGGMFAGGTVFGVTGDAVPSIPTAAPAPAAPAPAVAPVATVAPSPTPMADNVAASMGVTFGPGGMPNAAPTGVPTAPVAPQPVAAGGTMAAGQTSPAVMQLPNHNLAPERFRELFYSVATKCFNHIFTACQPQAHPTAQPTVDVKGFQFEDGVTKLAIELTPEEQQVVVMADCLDEMGRWCPQRPTSDGRLYGSVTQKARLPMYKLYINFNGQMLCRTLIPQNPNTRQNGALKTTAQGARNGQAVMYVYEGDDAVKQAMPQTALKSKCTNGQWEAINA